MERFQIVEVNPNDAVGGNGCVCGDSKVEGCDPPYAVFYATETDNNLSPHVVICERCAAAVVRKSDEYTKELATVQGEVVSEEIVEPEETPEENVTEFSEVTPVQI